MFPLRLRALPPLRIPRCRESAVLPLAAKITHGDSLQHLIRNKRSHRHVTKALCHKRSAKSGPRVSDHTLTQNLDYKKSFDIKDITLSPIYKRRASLMSDSSFGDREIGRRFSICIKLILILNCNGSHGSIEVCTGSFVHGSDLAPKVSISIHSFEL